MSLSEASPLVTTKWLAEHLDAPDVRVVDASGPPLGGGGGCTDYWHATGVT